MFIALFNDLFLNTPLFIRQISSEIPFTDTLFCQQVGGGGVQSPPATPLAMPLVVTGLTGYHKSQIYLDPCTNETTLAVYLLNQQTESERWDRERQARQSSQVCQDVCPRACCCSCSSHSGSACHTATSTCCTQERLWLGQASGTTTTYFRCFNPLRTVLNYGRWVGVPVFLPSDQLSGAPCRTQVLIIRVLQLRVHVNMHYYAIFMHSACVPVHMYMYTYALCGYTRHLCTCQYAAIQVNRPSGISQAAAIAVNRTQGVKSISSFLIYLKFSSVHQNNW